MRHQVLVGEDTGRILLQSFADLTVVVLVEMATGRFGMASTAHEVGIRLDGVGKVEGVD